MSLSGCKPWYEAPSSEASGQWIFQLRAKDTERHGCPVWSLIWYQNSDGGDVVICRLGKAAGSKLITGGGPFSSDSATPFLLVLRCKPFLHLLLLFYHPSTPPRGHACSTCEYANPWIHVRHPVCSQCLECVRGQEERRRYHRRRTRHQGIFHNRAAYSLCRLWLAPTFSCMILPSFSPDFATIKVISAWNPVIKTRRADTMSRLVAMPRQQGKDKSDDMAEERTNFRNSTL